MQSLIYIGMMDNLQKYKPTDKMIDLISDNYSLLQVMSRFGLSLGFGDKTVKEVCELNGVDCRTFLIVVNFMAEGFSRLDGDKDDISIPALIDYLRQAHIYFLDFSLPAIRRKLIEAIDCSQDDVAFLILKFLMNIRGKCVSTWIMKRKPSLSMSIH